MPLLFQDRFSSRNDEVEGHRFFVKLIQSKNLCIIFSFCEFEAHDFSWMSYVNRLQSSSGRSTNLLRCDVHNHYFFLYLIDVIIHTILPLSFTVLITHRMFPRNAFCIIHIKIFMTTFCFLCHRN